MRPLKVTMAVWIQYSIAAVLTVAGVASLAASGTVKEGTAQWLEGGTASDEFAAGFIGGFFGAALVLEGLSWIFWAGSHAVLGILNQLGKRPARILSWIQSGLSLACCGLGSLTGQVGFRYTYSDSSGDRSDELVDAMSRATPAWASAAELVALIVLLLGSLAVILLLVSKEANQFFARPVPPMPIYHQYQYPPQQYPGQGPQGPQGPPAPPGPGRPPGPAE